MNREEIDSDNTPLHELNGKSAIALRLITIDEYYEYIRERGGDTEGDLDEIGDT